MILPARLTEQCNLSSDYCYATSDHGADMSAETVDFLVDFAVSSTPSGDTPKFGFFGGEPFLCLDVMRTAAARVSERAAPAGVPIKLRVTTNGTLLNELAVNLIDNKIVLFLKDGHGPEDRYGKGKTKVENSSEGPGKPGVVQAVVSRRGLKKEP